MTRVNMPAVNEAIDELAKRLIERANGHYSCHNGVMSVSTAEDPADKMSAIAVIDSCDAEHDQACLEGLIAFRTDVERRTTDAL